MPERLHNIGGVTTSHPSVTKNASLRSRDLPIRETKKMPGLCREIPGKEAWQIRDGMPWRPLARPGHDRYRMRCLDNAKASGAWRLPAISSCCGRYPARRLTRWYPPYRYRRFHRWLSSSPACSPAVFSTAVSAGGHHKPDHNRCWQSR